jgi:hypothetical protein
MAWQGVMDVLVVDSYEHQESFYDIISFKVTFSFPAPCSVTSIHLLFVLCTVMHSKAVTSTMTSPSIDKACKNGLDRYAYSWKRVHGKPRFVHLAYVRTVTQVKLTTRFSPPPMAI